MALNIKTFTDINITTKYGDDINIEFTRTNQSGTIINTSSFSYLTEVQASQYDSPIFTLTTTGNSLGVWTLDIPRATITTNLIPNKTYYYQITETNSNNKQQCLIQGFLSFQSK